MLTLSSGFAPVKVPLKLGQFGFRTLSNSVDLGERVSSLEVAVLYLQHLSLPVESRGKLPVTGE